VFDETGSGTALVKVTHRPVAAAVVAASVDRDRARYAVDRNTRCGTASPEIAVSATLTEELRPHRVALPGLSDCARPRTRVEVTSIAPGVRVVRLSEVVVERTAR
jgi:hypothetical protein